eukprot:3062728-Prymnesium_polylepis.2
MPAATTAGDGQRRAVKGGAHCSPRGRCGPPPSGRACRARRACWYAPEARRWMLARGAASPPHRWPASAKGGASAAKAVGV